MSRINGNRPVRPGQFKPVKPNDNKPNKPNGHGPLRPPIRPTDCFEVKPVRPSGSGVVLLTPR